MSRPIPDIPDRELYRPRFSPWYGGEFAELMTRVKPYTLVSEESCYALYTLGLQALELDGHFWECGVHQGGSAMVLAAVIARQPDVARRPELHLFDTFTGTPPIDPHRDLPYPQRDQRSAEELEQAGLKKVRARLALRPPPQFHPGLIPETFRGLEKARIALAHIDVDLYQSVWDCCTFIYERMVPGGFMIFDDYGYPSCPGARQAVDAFFRDKPERPLVSPTAQALVFKLPCPV